MSMTSLGPVTEAVLKKETNRKRWPTVEQRRSLQKVVYYYCKTLRAFSPLSFVLPYAPSARVFDPRHRVSLPEDSVQYVQTDAAQRVIPEKTQNPNRGQNCIGLYPQ